MDGNVDVIVTDGFTGNIALKTAEGTANFITRNLKNSLNKLSILLSYSSLAKFRSKLDKDICDFFSFKDSIAFHMLVFLLFLAAVNGLSSSKIISSV